MYFLFILIKTQKIINSIYERPIRLNLVDSKKTLKIDKNEFAIISPKILRQNHMMCENFYKNNENHLSLFKLVENETPLNINRRNIVLQNASTYIKQSNICKKTKPYQCNNNVKMDYCNKIKLCNIISKSLKLKNDKFQKLFNTKIYEYIANFEKQFNDCKISLENSIHELNNSLANQIFSLISNYNESEINAIKYCILTTNNVILKTILDSIYLDKQSFTTYVETLALVNPILIVATVQNLTTTGGLLPFLNTVSIALARVVKETFLGITLEEKASSTNILNSLNLQLKIEIWKLIDSNIFQTNVLSQKSINNLLESLSITLNEFMNEIYNLILINAEKNEEVVFKIISNSLDYDVNDTNNDIYNQMV